jgi:hypothetical protein
MSIKVSALIKKEERVDPRTKNKSFEAMLSLLNEAGEEYGQFLPSLLAAGLAVAVAAGNAPESVATEDRSLVDARLFLQ